MVSAIQGCGDENEQSSWTTCVHVFKSVSVSALRAPWPAASVTYIGDEFDEEGLLVRLLHGLDPEGLDPLEATVGHRHVRLDVARRKYRLEVRVRALALQGA